MYNEPTQKELEEIPRLYSGEDVSLLDKKIHMHLFIGNCDWYIAEFDPADRLFFGFAILGDDYQNAEWGYISLDELLALRTAQGFEIDRDLYWQPKKAGEIERIRKCGR